MSTRRNDIGEIRNWVSNMFDQAIKWSCNDGQMRDPYESIYSENFAPPCWSVVAAGLYALTHEARYLEWAEKWIDRSSVMMRAIPALRSYLLGYAAMVLPILRNRVELPLLERIRQKYADTFVKDAHFGVCGAMHIAALQLVGNTYVPQNDENWFLERRDGVLSVLESRLNPAGFLDDDNCDGNSIPHMLLTCASLAIFLLDEDLDKAFKNRIVNVLAKTAAWYGKFNGDNHIPAQANRSYNQMYVYPLAALLGFVGAGKSESARIDSIFDYQRQFVDCRGRPAITPNYLSPYATAGVETNYNRLINDLGVGALAWTVLLLLQKHNWPGINLCTKVVEENFCDEKAGYGVFNRGRNRVFFALRSHRQWQYHLPLQPISICFPSQIHTPFCGAKRSGVNNQYLKLIPDASKINPLLDPYFGIYAGKKNGGYVVMGGKAGVLPDGGYKLAGDDMELSFDVRLENNSLLLGYRYDINGAERAFFAVPILLWDGKDELSYEIERNMVRMAWKGRKYLLGALQFSETWTLAMERSLSTGYGISGHFVIPIKSSGQIAISLSDTTE